MFTDAESYYPSRNKTRHKSYYRKVRQMPCQDYYCSSSYLTTPYYPKIHTGVTLQVSILYHCDKNGSKISSF